MSETGIIQKNAFYNASTFYNTAKQALSKSSAHELTAAIKENISIDWNLRESARAKMRITVRRLLKKYGYPPDLQKLAVEKVVKQAGNMEN